MKLSRRRAIIWAAGLLLLLILLAQVPFLYRHFWSFPRFRSALAELRQQREAPALTIPLRELRGVLHCHSHLSHDSQGSETRILQAAKTVGIDFLFMTDHKHQPGHFLHFNDGIHGFRDSVLFFVGAETKDGLMPWNVDTVALDLRRPTQELIDQIIAAGGVVFFAHPEERRFVDRTNFTGMEIYNIHTDAKDAKPLVLALQSLYSLRKYPELVFRLIFDPPSSILRDWDALTQQRPVVGISGTDAHNNVGVMGTVIHPDTLFIQDTGGHPVTKVYLSGWKRALFSLLFGPLDAGRQVFRVGLDPYEISMGLVNTHLLVPEHSAAALVEALRRGHAFVAFESLAPGEGFAFVVENDSLRGIMGDEVAFESGLTLHAAAPLPGRFLLVRNGEVVDQIEARSAAWPVGQPGVYRVEVHLRVLGDWIPWIYSNPIYVR